MWLYASIAPFYTNYFANKYVEIDKYLNNKKSIQSQLLTLLENEDQVDENVEKMITILNNNNDIKSDKRELKDFLYLVSNIADNHYRSSTFFEKIGKIILLFSNEINQTFSNEELFDVFQQNKKILLFLIEKKFIKINKNIIEKMANDEFLNLTQFFSPEISEFTNETVFQPPENFYKKRKNGINDDKLYLYHIIQNDKINEFIKYIKLKDIHLQNKFKPSIYETHLFLQKNHPTIIECSAFYGSINIFKYCYSNGANVTSSIWLYAVHGKNIELFQFLERNHIKPPNNSYDEILEEAIKCHHNDIAIFIKNSYIYSRIEDYDIDLNINKNILNCVFKSHNYEFFPKNYNHEFIIHYLFEYKYYNLIVILLKSRLINKKYINSSEKESIKDLYDFNDAKEERTKKINNANQKTNDSSGIYFNTILKFNGNEIQIGSNKIKIKQIKDSYFLGLNEAFSSSPNESKFIKASLVFDKIIESEIEESYVEVSQRILNEIELINDSSSIESIHEKIFYLISNLFINISRENLDKIIDDCGGMINHILPKIFNNNSLSTEKKTIEINEPFLSAGLILFYHEAINSELIKTTSFSLFKQNKNSTISLTRIAKNKISSSKYPCIAMLFGSLRTGKSTIASHLISGPKSKHNKTLFKSAGSSKSCTKSINSVGPIKFNDFASSFEIITEEFNESHLNRDIFIVDSEGLNSFDDETPWLKKALLAMLSVNTVSLYVAKSMNKADLDQFMKYIKLVRVIGGGMEIHHRLGYINNQEKFDGSNIIDQYMNQDESATNKIINEFSKFKSFNLDESHFKFMSVLSFDRHSYNEYFKSLSEVARFILNACINEKTIINGEMIVNIIEEFANKLKDNNDLDDADLTFETIFIKVLENAFNKSVQEQMPEIQKEIYANLSSMPVLELNLLDVDKYITKMKNNGFVDKIINRAIEKTLPDIKKTFPFIVKASQINLINSLKNIVHQVRKELIPAEIFEVPDLGYGFSIVDGTFKKKVLDLKPSQELTKIKINNDVIAIYHLPNNFLLGYVPERFQKFEIKSNSSLNNFLTEITPKSFNDEKYGYFSPKNDFIKSCKIVENLIGISFENNMADLLINTNITVNVIAHVSMNNYNMKYLSFDLKKKFDKLEKIMETKEVESKEVETFVSEIFSEYGEFVASGFFVGNYIINISTNNEINYQDKGHSSFYSTEKNKTKQYSHFINFTRKNVVLSYGNQIKPSTFMIDLSQSPSFDSSFTPLSKYATSQKVSQALEYWKVKRNKKPKTLVEYLRFNGLLSAPKGKKIVLYNNENIPYEVIINNDGQIEIPDSIIRYDFRSEEKGVVLKSYSINYNVILDPVKMTIGGFYKEPYEKKWKRRTGRHRRAFGNEHLYLYVRLNPFWEFEQKITKDLFDGDGVNYMKITILDNQSFKIEFQNLPDGSGKSYTKGPYSIRLKQNLKVKLV